MYSTFFHINCPILYHLAEVSNITQKNSIESGVTSTEVVRFKSKSLEHENKVNVSACLENKPRKISVTQLLLLQRNYTRKAAIENHS